MTKTKTLEELEEIFPWGWEVRDGRGRILYRAREVPEGVKEAYITSWDRSQVNHPTTWKVHMGLRELLGSNLLTGWQPSPVEALKVAKGVLEDRFLKYNEEVAIYKGILSPEEGRAVEARGALYAIERLIQEDGHDVAADLIVGAMRSESFTGGCFLCRGRGWYEDVSPGSARAIVYPCACNDAAKGKTYAVRVENGQMIAESFGRKKEVLTEDDPRWCSALSEWKSELGYLESFTPTTNPIEEIRRVVFDPSLFGSQPTPLERVTNAWPLVWETSTEWFHAEDGEFEFIIVAGEEGTRSHALRNGEEVYANRYGGVRLRQAAEDMRKWYESNEAKGQNLRGGLRRDR